MLDSATPDPPRPQLRSPPDLYAAAEEGEDRAKAGVLEDNDAVDPPSMNLAIHANTIDLPPQSLSVSLVAELDTANTGPSPRKPVTERTEGHLPQLWHGGDNIV